jgi:hypothetical protein
MRIRQAGSGDDANLVKVLIGRRKPSQLMLAKLEAALAWGSEAHREH